MANGDAAVSAGMSKVLGTADRRLGYDEINLSRDYTAGGPNYWTSGTTVPLSKGGTGATAAPAARTNLQLDTYYIGNASAGTNGIKLYWATNRLGMLIDGTDQGGVAILSEILPKAGGTMTGSLIFGSGVLSAVTSGYSSLYVNGDGRVGFPPSARRFKKFISLFNPRKLGNIWPAFNRFQLREGDGSWKYGPIADDMLQVPEQAQFVIRDDQGEPMSVDFVALLVAQVAELNERVKDLEGKAA